MCNGSMWRKDWERERGLWTWVCSSHVVSPWSPPCFVFPSTQRGAAEGSAHTQGGPAPALCRSKLQRAGLNTANLGTLGQSPPCPTLVRVLREGTFAHTYTTALHVALGVYMTKIFISGSFRGEEVLSFLHLLCISRFMKQGKEPAL